MLQSVNMGTYNQNISDTLDVPYNIDVTTLLPNGSNISLSNVSSGMDFLGDETTLDTVGNILVRVGLIIIMLGMGCCIEVNNILQHLKRPIGPAIGMLCQFVLMPLGMFGLAHASNLESFYAIGLIVLAATPGGAMSNLFTFWVDGDIPLR